MNDAFRRAGARMACGALMAAAASMVPAQAQDQYVGQLMYNPYGFAPQQWAACDGQLLPISSNTALFSLLGTYYGGDGKSTFALPDMRGRVPIGASLFGSGPGPGLNEYDIGQGGGAETATLTVSNLPSHTHSLSGITAGAVSASSTNANSAVPAGHALANTGHNPAYNTAAPDVNLATMTLNGTSGIAGGTPQPFAIRTPYLVVNCVIALQGIFPQRQ